jgi:hypothetical protein
MGGHFYNRRNAFNLLPSKEQYLCFNSVIKPLYLQVYSTLLDPSGMLLKNKIQ